MQLLRSLAYPIALAWLTFWYSSQVILVSLFSKDPKRVDRTYRRVVQAWARKQLAIANVKVRTVGVEKIPQDRPVVFVSNHQSWIDIISLVHVTPGNMRFVSKKELAKVPVLGRAMRASGTVFIDRQNRQRAFSAYEEAAATIRSGISAVVFVEGTRSRTGELQPFKKGPFVLAIAAQVEVVPVYCAGTFGILPKGTIFIRPRPVTLFYGDPIPTAGLGYEDREQLLAEARRVIVEMRDRAAQEHLL